MLLQTEAFDFMFVLLIDCNKALNIRTKNQPSEVNPRILKKILHPITVGDFKKTNVQSPINRIKRLYNQ